MKPAVFELKEQVQEAPHDRVLSDYARPLTWSYLVNQRFHNGALDVMPRERE
jgi:hypothetical protein